MTASAVDVLEGRASWAMPCAAVLPFLQSLPAGCVQTCVTSPPYYGLRSYLPAGHADKVHEIGSEATPAEYIAKMVEVFGYVRRVMRADAVLWLNLGDSFSGSGGYYPDSPSNAAGSKQSTNAGSVPSMNGRRSAPGVKQGDLQNMPHRVAAALQADGWYWRQTVVWAKRSPMPESIGGVRWERCRVKVGPKEIHDQPWARAANNGRPGAIQYTNGGVKGNNYAKWEPCPGCPKCSATDGWILRRGRWRNTTAHEMLFMLTPSNRYFCDGDAAKETAVGNVPGNKAHRGADAYVNGDDHHRTKSGLASVQAVERRNPRSVWTLSSESFKGAHFACVDDETEALTPEGWKRQADLKDGEWIAAYNQEADCIRWEAATFHRYDFDGELVAIDKRDSSQRLTPNHRCPVRKRKKSGGHRVAVVEAGNLNSRHDLLMTGPWSIPPICGIGRDLAELIGWYVTEGEKPRRDRSGGRLKINQSESANPEKVIRIRGLLVSLGADFLEWHRTKPYKGRESREVMFAVGGPVAERLNDLCPDKRIPKWSFELPTNEAQAMLASLIDGDGSRRKDGRSCIIQKDREHIERMQTLAMRCGYRAMLSTRKEGTFCLHLTTGRWLTVRNTSGKGVSLGRESYSGVVWCPSVRSGFWLARRKGMPFITGNTFPSELPRRCIEASTSAAGCCPACGSCWAPMVERERVATRPGTDSKIRVPSGWNTAPGSHDTTDGYYLNGQASQKVMDSDIVGNRDPYRHVQVSRVLGYRPTCRCAAPAAAVPCIVLDPFAGSGTTLQVATHMGRRAIGCDLNADYIHLAHERIATVPRCLRPKKAKPAPVVDTEPMPLFGE